MMMIGGGKKGGEVECERWLRWERRVRGLYRMTESARLVMVCKGYEG